jgi:4-hydroxy-tetrahydrodipicolinate reductase
MANAGTSKPRVVIYGCGQYGGFVARFAVQKGWPIVAAFNRAGAKVGQDLGRVIGLDRDIGVVVQDCDTANYESLRGRADIGVVAMTNQLKKNLPAYTRLMNAGLNVICHGTEAYFPWGNDKALASEIDQLAKKNGVTFTGSGIWDMSRIWSGILVCGPCTEIKSLYHRSITDAKGQAQHAQQAIDHIGCGMSVAEFKRAGFMDDPMAVSYKTIPEQVLWAQGYTITKTSSRIEPVVTEEPLYSELLATTIPAGHVLGTRIIGEIETKEGVTARADIELRIFRPGEVEHMFWEVDGLPRSRIRVEREDSAHATGANLFNRIPDVIAAAPGIVVVSQMGPLKTTATA